MTRYDRTDICCLPFDPAPWDEKEVTWREKLFVRRALRVFFHVPWPPSIGRMMKQTWEAAVAAGADPELEDFIWLATDISPFRSEHYIHVTREVPGLETVRLTGTYLTKAYDGPYNAVPRWIKDFNTFAAARGKKVSRHYVYYTTCPKCAKKYGHNWSVLFGQVA